MKKFILLYKGPATPMEQIDPEKGKEIMQAWQEWMEKIGDSLDDMGKPMANGVSVVDDGSSAEATKLNGYSFIQAENIDEAKKLVDGHPFLSDKTGEFSVEIFELLDLPGM